MRKCAILCLVFLLLSGTIRAAGDVVRIRVFLKDKKTESVNRPTPKLSFASLKRRENQGILLDSTDNPLSETYLKDIQDKGYPIVCQSRWMNTVVVSASDSICMDTLRLLPYVKKVQLVWKRPFPKQSESLSAVARIEMPAPDSSSYYGKATQQIRMLGLDTLHEMGYKGAGKMVAVLDAGFNGVDSLSWFKNISLVAVKDFVYPFSSVFQGNPHGTSVLSIMASKKPYIFIGTAPDASYCLLRSEDANTEFPIEEDYWVAAVEFADSIGADVVSSSLGYTVFDDPGLSYRRDQLNGMTSFISCGAAVAANKGLLLVSSAGNEGNLVWKKLNFPADVDQVLTVGSVNSDLTRSSFCSLGPTADGRIKPDVMALGAGTRFVNSFGSLVGGNGTSFSAPLVAGMVASVWSAFPGLKATELLSIIRQSSSRASLPDSIYGYGIPSVEKMIHTLRDPMSQTNRPAFNFSLNSTKHLIQLTEGSLGKLPAEAVVYNSLGKIILKKKITGRNSTIDLSGLPDSMYLVGVFVSGKPTFYQKIAIPKE